MSRLARGVALLTLISSSRAYTGRATFFSVGQGACGWSNTNSDFIVALNEEQYGNLNAVSGWCGTQITIQYGGQTAQAQIADACPGCPWGALDMSPSLFAHFANPSMGVIYVTWYPSNQAPAPAPSPTWSPTTWWQAPTTAQWTATPTWTSTYWPPPQMSSAWSASSLFSSALASSASASASLWATGSSSASASVRALASQNPVLLLPNATIADTEVGTFAIAGQFVLSLGNLAVQALVQQNET